MDRRIPLFASLVLLTAALAVPGALRAQDAADFLTSHIEERRQEYSGVAHEIWELAEVGYQEEESSRLLQGQLADAGFEIETGVADMPTAFVAEWGSGGPVIGILAEMDALPGITNAATPEREPLDQRAGHACGHHLFGAGSVAAAIAVKAWLQETGREGTIRLYGTPAEEGGAGKVYMVRAGLMDDLDVAIHWHPGSSNEATPGRSLANKSAKFRFTGRSSHAAGAPERGRSALDGVEAMNYMVNMLREHVPEDTRIHYVITAGGGAPNVVPDFSEVYYYVRHPDPETDMEIFDRVAKAAEAAAMGTGTEMEYEIIHGLYPVLPNVTLQRVMHENLQRVGGVEYDAREREFARQIRGTLGDDAPPISEAQEVQPFGEIQEGGGSTDVGDVSWQVPTVGLSTATWVPGTSAHSWQAVAAGGMSIGEKGMINAAKTMAMTAADLFQSPETIAEATEEWRDRIPDDFAYEPLLGDRPPPLDYRENPGGD